MAERSQVEASWVVDATPETFASEVFDRSQEVPVVVDFWAEWCGPCRFLGPILEKLCEESKGRFHLVKANTDRLLEAAASFRVDSIPAVFGVVDAEVVDFFVGALPEPQIRAWLDSLLLTGDLARARRLETSAPGQAEAAYRRVLEADPNAADAAIGLARSLVALGREGDAEEILQRLEGRGFLEPEAERLKALLAFRSKTDLDVEACRTAAESNPDDLNLQVRWAEALAAAGRHREALETCLELVTRDRHGVGERARQVMVDIFRVLPDDSELVPEYRRKLAMVLY
jgi:putative thioredoxin